MRIFYFTNSYPYGPGTVWKKHELEAFANDGTKIKVIPFNFGNNTVAKDSIPGVSYLHPLFTKVEYVSLRKRVYAMIISKHRRLFLEEFFRNRVFFRKSHLVSWVAESFLALRLSQHPEIHNLVKESGSDTIWYFFWGRQSSLLIPLIGNKTFKVACRFHGYDLYKERNDGYIPYQHQQVDKTDLVLPCSEHGRVYLKKEYPGLQDRKVYKSRLGTKFYGLSQPSCDGILRIVSCSNAVPIKRIHLLLEAMKLVTGEIKWTHIGGGELLESLRHRSSSIIRPNIGITFTGNLSNDLIRRFYAETPCDLFVNVSESEGVPVSIMEALASGIPVYATNVGGTSEIVDENVGRLLPKELDGVTLAKFLDEYLNISTERRATYRRNAFERFENDWNAQKNAMLLKKRFEDLIAGSEKCVS